MYDYLQQKYSCDYILTFRLNQDVLEKHFAYIRGMGGSNDHPSPLDFQYRLKWFILGKNSASVLTNNQNTSSQSTEQCFLKVDDCIAADDGHPVELCVTQELFVNIVTEPPVTVELEEEKVITYSFIEPNYCDLEEAHTQPLEELLDNFELKDLTN
jgi:hypothetical protein